MHARMRLLPWSGSSAGSVQCSDDLESNEAYGILDGEHRSVVTACSATRGAVYYNVTTPFVQSEADREIGMTPNEAYGDLRINTDGDGSKSAEEQDDYDYVLN